MIRKTFTVTLLSDLVLSSRSATEGNQTSLDFIPGSTFLGVCAGRLYDQITPELAFDLFHSSKVRFGDAHPVLDNHRMLRTPLAWYKPKTGELRQALYMHQAIKEDLKDDKGKPIQIKQCRDGFISPMKDNQWTIKKIHKRFAIKSAYDRIQRRAKDEQMFGYESIPSGLVFSFYIDFDDVIAKDVIQQIVDAVTGTRRLGKSTSAEYALARIEEDNTVVNAIPQMEAQNAVLVYAESRLIFFDKHGQVTLQPSPEQLGFINGSICWEKSQIRTFQYAPYNKKRASRDADRCGIEKGSVFYLKNVSIANVDQTHIESGVGSYLNEGFGRILLNPAFLKAKENEPTAAFTVSDNGSLKPITKGIDEYLDELAMSPTDRQVLDYLKKAGKEKTNRIEVYNQVNQYVKDNWKYFQGKERWASQWGGIREKAIIAPDKDDLLNLLFRDEDGYLTHGVASEQWKGHRIKELKKFIEDLDESIARETVINLAAEMAKKCKKED